KNKAFITYRIIENEPYMIDSFFQKTADVNIFKILSEENGSLIKTGEKYVQNTLSKERQRVEDFLRDNGYFSFSKSYIEYNVYKDSIAKTVGIEQLIQSPRDAETHTVYKVDSIQFTIDSPVDVIPDEEVQIRYNGIDYSLYKDRYAERIIDSRIFLETGVLYSRKDAIETQRQLANLDIFSFVNITFDTLGNSLNTHILTRPNQKYQITNQLG